MDLVGDVVADAGDRVGQVGSGLGDSVGRFLASAAQGGFAVSPTGGRALLNVIDDFMQWMAQTKNAVQVISQRPPLGQLAGGTTMAPFMVEVATDPNGFATRFRELEDTLTKVEDAINKAMANYQATEMENEQLLDQLRGHSG